MTNSHKFYRKKMFCQKIKDTSSQIENRKELNLTSLVIVHYLPSQNNEFVALRIVEADFPMHGVK